MAGPNYFDQFDGPKGVPIGQADPRRPAQIREAEANAQRAAGEAPYAATTAAARAREAQANATVAEQKARDVQQAHTIIPTSNVHGPAYLNQLPAEIRGVVDGVVEGRIPLPPNALRTPYWQQILQHATNVDPKFDAVNFNARNKARQDFTSGPDGLTLTSLETALLHERQVRDAAGALNNWNSPIANSVRDAYMWATGDGRIGDFENKRDQYANEKQKVFVPTNGTEGDRIQARNEMPLNASPDTFNHVFSGDATLYRSRMQALQAKYQRAMGTTADITDLLSPEARQTYAELTGQQNGSIPFGGVNGMAGGAAPTNGGPGGPGGGPPSIGGPSAPPGGGSPFDQPNAGPGAVAATGATRSVFDPIVAAKVDAMARAKRSPAEINAYLASAGSSAVDPKVIQANEDYLTSHPNYGGFVNATKEVPTTAMERASASPAAAYFSGALNAVTAGYPDEIGGAASALAGGDYTQTRDMLNANKHALADLHPTANFAGNVAGGLASTLGGAGVVGRLAPRAAGAATALLGKAAPAAGDAAYGALYGSGEDNDNRLGGAIAGAGTAWGGGMLGRSLTRGISSRLSPVVSDGVQNLADHGIIMSAAQRAAANGSFLGKTRLGLENAMTHLPGLGDAIQAQRTRQIAQFGNGLINDAISPIGAKVEGVSGNAAVDAAHSAVSDAYDKSLPGISGPLDQSFLDAHAQLLDRVKGLPQGQRELFDTIYNRKVAPFMPAEGTPMTGQALQDIKRGIDKPMMKLGRSGDPADEYLADELGNMRQNYFDWAQRAAPDKAADFQNASTAFRNMVRVDRAAGAAKRDGLFTPDQALNAIKVNSSPQQFASGNAPMQGYAQDAAQILPSTLPDSGTGKRTLVNSVAALLAGGGTALNPATMIPIAVGAGKSVRYLPRVDSALQSLAIGERPPLLDDTGAWLRGQQRRVGMMGSAGLLYGTTN